MGEILGHSSMNAHWQRSTLLPVRIGDDIANGASDRGESSGGNRTDCCELSTGKKKELTFFCVGLFAAIFSFLATSCAALLEDGLFFLRLNLCFDGSAALTFGVTFSFPALLFERLPDIFFVGLLLDSLLTAGVMYSGDDTALEDRAGVGTNIFTALK